MPRLPFSARKDTASAKRQAPDGKPLAFYQSNTFNLILWLFVKGDKLIFGTGLWSNSSASTADSKKRKPGVALFISIRVGNNDLVLALDQSRRQDWPTC